LRSISSVLGGKNSNEIVGGWRAAELSGAAGEAGDVSLMTVSFLTRLLRGPDAPPQAGRSVARDEAGRIADTLRTAIGRNRYSG
jgi:hypothetical protein